VIYTLSAVPAARSLGEIADSIRAHWSATEDDRFAIGRDLIEARERFPSDPEFGQWMKAQEFPFNRQWGYTLRLAAENEPAVRAVLTSQLVSGRTPNIEKALAAVLHPIAMVPDPTPAGYRELLAAFKAVAALAGIVDDVFMAATDTQNRRLRAAAHRASRVVRRVDVDSIKLSFGRTE
jgi:hypothetical protein